MRFEAIKLDPIDRYAFIIGTREKPDREIRDLIEGQINKGMEALGFSPDSYSVTVQKGDSREEREGPEYPSLSPSTDYLLFAIVRTGGNGDSTEPLSNREIEEKREELAKAIFPPEGSRIALVLLQDSIVDIVISKGVPRAVIHADRRASPSRRSGYRRRY